MLRKDTSRSPRHNSNRGPRTEITSEMPPDGTQGKQRFLETLVPPLRVLSGQRCMAYSVP